MAFWLFVHLLNSGDRIFFKIFGFTRCWRAENAIAHITASKIIFAHVYDSARHHAASCIKQLSEKYSPLEKSSAAIDAISRRAGIRPFFVALSVEKCAGSIRSAERNGGVARGVIIAMAAYVPVAKPRPFLSARGISAINGGYCTSYFARAAI